MLGNTVKESEEFLKGTGESREGRMSRLLVMSERALESGDSDRVVEIRKMYEYEKICLELGV